MPRPLAGFFVSGEGDVRLHLAAGSLGRHMRLLRHNITPSSTSWMTATHIMRAQVDRVTEEDRTILAALAGIETKSESETEDD